MKVQALLAKEEKPEEQDQHSLHVAKDLKRYSGEPADADELAQINADGNEAWECEEELQSDKTQW